MNVLITGGAGFIGSNLADRLIARGDDVTVIDNLETGRIDNVNEKVNFFEGSITCKDLLSNVFNSHPPDVVVHAAASYKDPDDWEKDLYVNGIGTINLVRECEKHDIKRLVYFQTALCYGHQPEEQPITLSHPINPDNSYALSKTVSERVIEMTDLNYVSFRLANCYGPRNMSGPVPTFFKRLTQEQECFISDSRRDFIFVDDLVDIVVKAIDMQGEPGHYHLASGTDYAIEDVFNILKTLLEKEGLITPVPSKYFGRFFDDVKTILLEPSKTLETFGMLPSTTLDVGIPRAVEWYKTHEMSETFTHLKNINPPEEDRLENDGE